MLPSLPGNLRSSPLQLSPQPPLSYLCSPPLLGPSPKYANTFKTLPSPRPLPAAILKRYLPLGPKPSLIILFLSPPSYRLLPWKDICLGHIHVTASTSPNLAAVLHKTSLVKVSKGVISLISSEGGCFLLKTLFLCCWKGFILFAFSPCHFLESMELHSYLSLNIGLHKISSLALSSCLLHSEYAPWLHLFPCLQLPCPCRYVENLYLKSRSSELQI